MSIKIVVLCTVSSVEEAESIGRALVNEELVREAPAIVSCQSPSALAAMEDSAKKPAWGG